MNKKSIYITILGIIFVSITGFFCHFAFQFSDKNYFIGLITPINESIWEHMKLVFFPMLFFSFFIKFIFRSAYISQSLSMGIIFGTLSIPVLFYTYSGALGFNIYYIDISIFFIAVLCAFIVSFKSNVNNSSNKYNGIYSIIVFILLILFLLFTYNPPCINLFKDPQISENASLSSVISKLDYTKNCIINYIEQLSIYIFGNQ